MQPRRTIFGENRYLCRKAWISSASAESFCTTVAASNTSKKMEKNLVYTTCGKHRINIREVDVTIENDRVKRVQFIGGCHGNAQGIAALIAGMEVDEAIAKLSGIDCGGKGTSCPDQLAKALTQLKNSR